MSYYFFIDEVMLPVPPAKMTISTKNRNKTISLIDDGDVNLLKAPGLTDIKFDLLLPNKWYPFADYSQSRKDLIISTVGDMIGGIAQDLARSYTYKPAEYFYKYLRNANRKKKPIRFIVTRLGVNFQMLFDTNILMSVEACDLNEDAKQGNDLIVKLALKEYKPYGTKEVTVKKGKDGNYQATVKKKRFTDKATPNALKVTKEKSVLEAVKLASNGGLNWKSVAHISNMLYPSKTLEKGDKLTLG